MLRAAQLYEEDLRYEFEKIWYNEEYKYYFNDNFYCDIEVSLDTCQQHQFVSIDSDENIIGYIAYNIDRQTDNVNNLCAINFNHNKAIFGIDLIQAVDDIFLKFNFNKINFNVIIGNPAEGMYDKFVKMCKGRIVGVMKKHTKLVDGKIYDIKYYEITRDNWIKNRNRFYK